MIVIGSLAAACDVTPQAATVNGTSISASTLNGHLSGYEKTVAGQCLLEVLDPQAYDQVTEGAGGSGTYDMAFTDAILDRDVSNTLAAQYAASKGLHVSSSDLSAASGQYANILTGDIQQIVEEYSNSGLTSFCEDASGQAVSGAELLASLPAGLRDAEIANQAVDEKLLTDGADLSDQAVSQYYAAHQDLFEVDCVSVIVASTEADANQYISQINGGASFASVAEAHSLDTQTASSGGALGCNYTQSDIEQSLGLTSVSVGTPVGPIQDTSNNVWTVYEVTKQTVEPLASTRSLIRQELLLQTANVTREVLQWC